MQKVYAFVASSYTGKSNEQQKGLVTHYAVQTGLSPEIVEGRRSKKKKWREQTDVRELINSLQPGDILIVPDITFLGADGTDRLSCISTILRKGAALHFAESELVLDPAVLGEKGRSFLALMYLLSMLLQPESRAKEEKRGRKRGPGRPPKKRRGRPPKRRGPGRPPKKRVGRPPKKKKPGRKPSRKKRVSPLLDRFNKEILTIRKYLRRRFSIRAIASMLNMPYQPLRALIKKHPTLSLLAKRRNSER